MDLGLEQHRYRFYGLLISLYFLATRIPAQDSVIFPPFHSRLSVLNVILSYSFIDHGLRTFTFTTYAESKGGFHLYALTGAPLVEILGPSGLRWWSLFITALTLPVVYWFTANEYDRDIALIATGVLCVSPMFAFFGTAIFPSVFELLFSTIAVAVYAQARRTNYPIQRKRVYIGVSIAAFCIAIIDHFWALYVLAPIAWTSLRDREFDIMMLYSVIGITVTGVAYYIRNLTPDGRSIIRAYSILYHWDLYLAPSFYIDVSYSVFRFAFSRPIAIVITVAAFYYFFRQRHELVSVWYIAGLSIPAVFPRGVAFHFYYIFGLLVPGAILTALVVRDVSGWEGWENIHPNVGNHMPKVGVGGVFSILLLTAYLFSGPGFIIGAEDGSEVLQEGTDIAEVMASNNIETSDVAVVTTLPANKTETGETQYLHGYLIYGRLYLQAPNSPMVVRSREDAQARNADLIIDVRQSYIENQTKRTAPTLLVKKNDTYQPTNHQINADE